MKINVLGTPYTLSVLPAKRDQYLSENTCAGYIDRSIKRIVIRKQEEKTGSLDDMEAYRREVIRHELVHAFMFESGAADECHWHCEEAVDWMAMQLPKIVNACVEAGAWP